MADLLDAFKTHVTSMVRRLEDLDYFQDRQKLPKNQRRVLEEVLEGTHPNSEWPNVLFELTVILSGLHKKKTIVLIDEYDTPMTNASVAKYPYPSEVILFLRWTQLVFSFFWQAHTFLRKVYAQILKVTLACS